MARVTVEITGLPPANDVPDYDDEECVGAHAALSEAVVRYWNAGAVPDTIADELQEMLQQAVDE